LTIKLIIRLSYITIIHYFWLEFNLKIKNVCIMKSLKRISPFLMALAVLFVVACQSDADDARAQARESLASTAPAETVKPTANTPAAKPANAAPAGPTTTVEYSESSFDFGTIPEGEKVSHEYKFKNTGNEPLVISNAKGSCGCTVPQWPKTPIAPGESGSITVEFNSKGKPGKQTKRVTVTANTNPPQSFLTITGQVEKAAATTNK
jgi:hypothetical protein